MGGPTFVNEKVVHILEKNNIAVNFETKDGDFCYMHLKSIVQISNLKSLTEVPLFPLMHVLDLSGSQLAKDLQVKIGIAGIIENQSGV